MPNKKTYNKIYKELIELYEIDKDVYTDEMTRGSFRDGKNELLEACLRAHLGCFNYVLSLLKEEEEVSDARFRKIRI